MNDHQITRIDLHTVYQYQIIMLLLPVKVSINLAEADRKELIKTIGSNGQVPTKEIS